MPMFARVSSLWRNLSRQSNQDSELSEELQAYMEMLVDRKVELGMSPEQARRTAMIEIGGVEQVKEQVREVKAGFLLETFWRDIRCGARSLMKSRGFAVAAILSLGVGIGLNSAVFSAVHAVLLRPLPYKDPDRLVSVEQTLKRYRNGSVGAGVAAANFLDWQAHNRSFEAMAIYDRVNTRRVLSTPGGAAVIRGYNVSANFFLVLGVQAAIGRTFLPNEDTADASVAVISDQLWRRTFAGDANVVGSIITVDDRIRTIIGVMGQEFRYYQPSAMFSDTPGIDIFLPNAFANTHPTNRQNYLNSVIARLRPEVSLEKAQAEMNTIARQLAEAYPKENKDSGALVSPLDFESSTTRSSLLLAWGAMGVLLLISSANVASLILVRTEARRHEMVIRLAIGAGRGRLMRQLLTESLLLGISGAAIGLALACIGSESIAWVLPNAEQIRGLETATIDSNVFAFTLLVSVAIGLLCGFVPAIRASRSDQLGSIQVSGRTTSDPRAGVRLRSALVVLQIALSMVLLAGAGLMVQSVLNLYHLNYAHG